MNYSFKINYRLLYSIGSMLFVGCLLISCSKIAFEKRNTDPTRLEKLSTDEIKGLFPTALLAGMNAGQPSIVDYQRPQNLFADDYAQYYGSTQPAFSSDRYNIVQGWAEWQFHSTYIACLPPLAAIIENTKGDPSGITMNAIARIWKVWILARTTDYFGPIPYFKIGSAESVIPYDSQEDVYHDFFKELDEATTDLKNNLSVPSFQSSDIMYNGDNSKWLKFGNSLRLRLAMRVSYVDPQLAKDNAEAAVLRGVMTDVADDGYVKTSAPDNFNGLGRISGWNEFRMSQTFESLFKGWNDPRMSLYFQPAEGTGLYKGVRNGMIPAEMAVSENGYVENSNVAVKLTPQFMYVTPISVMFSAESYFLRAEGTLNKWNMGGGTAEDYYNKGIENSIKAWGMNDLAIISNYINGTTPPYAPGGYFNTPALTDIPVKFSPDPEKQLEQIITQKWIAVFPDGYEGWAEMRRTGFPKRYPLIHSDNPDLSPDELIRRIPFLDFDRERNAQAVEAAVSLLKGPDNAATRLWWDVK